MKSIFAVRKPAENGVVSPAKRRSTKLRGEDGAAMVETAISASVLLMVLIGMTQLFMALYGYHYVAYAAREGTRWAMVRGSECSIDSATMPNCGAVGTDVQTHVQGLGFPGIDSTKVTASVKWMTASSPTASAPTAWTLCSTDSPDPGCNAPGHMVVVDVTYAYPLSIPFLNNQTVNMTSTSSMAVTQ
jgi:Flp pilus assembly protein TadG